MTVLSYATDRAADALVLTAIAPTEPAHGHGRSLRIGDRTLSTGPTDVGQQAVDVASGA